MKAIETIYKWYRFRSRLEARWAVFFDAMGIEWEYEPEGFALDDGTNYLPDFFLPNVKHLAFSGKCEWDEEIGDYVEEQPPLCKDCSTGLFVEVKGNMTQEDAHKVLAFSKIAPIIVVGNIPKDTNEAYRFYLSHRWVNTSGLTYTPYDFGEFDGDLLTHGVLAFKSNDMLFTRRGDDVWCCGMRSPWWGGDYEMNSALIKARQARFEHGEKPDGTA